MNLSLFRAGASVIGQVALKPGNYSVNVRGAGASTGAFEVQLHLVGDLNGDGQVNQSDLDLIDSNLSVPDQAISRLAKRNLGAASQTVTFQVKNATGGQFADAQVYVAIYGMDPSAAGANNPSGWVYFDASGQENNLYGSGGALASVPNFTLAQAPAGIAVPKNLHIIAGEVFVGLGSPVTLRVNTDGSGHVLGVAAPSASNPTDPNRATYWDFAEFTLTGPGSLNTDTSLVDQFGFPLTVQVTPTDPALPSGAGVFPPRSTVINAFQSFVGANSPFMASVTQAGTGPSGPYRITAPQNAILLNPSLALATYYNSYIQQLFTQYQTSTVTINVPNPIPNTQPTTYTFVGQVVQVPNMANPGSPFTVFRFTGQNADQTGKQYDVYDPFTPPPWLANPSELPTQMVFANDGVFADNTRRGLDNTSSKILGNIENQVVSAMNRGVALDPYGFWTDPTKFYPANATANYYAAFWHQSTISIGGFAYAFPFDDQGNNSTDMTSINPTQMTITVGWNTPLG
jgi:hypothetical protein